MNLSPRTLAGLSCLLLAATLAPSAMGQQVYRIVGPDGRVTFSDRPPAEPNAKATTKTVSGGGAGSTAALPFELRQAANQYPVTLYTSPNCLTCVNGRTFLQGRGIPFTERTITSNEDIEALKRLSGAGTVPFLTIGGQQLRGYSQTEWTQFLDAAGYPKVSQLPSSYQNAPPAPLVAVNPRPDAAPRTAAPQATADAGGTDTSPQPLEPPPSNPAGIRF